MTNISLDTKSHPLKDFFSTPVVTILASIISTFAVATLFFKLSGPVPISVSQTSVEAQQPFQVTGQASVAIAPDEATINLGVTATNQNLSAAQDHANSTINSVSDALKELGVGDSNIKTTNYQINPSYQFNRGDRQLTGYTVNTNLQVTLSDFAVLNSAIDQATALGANQVGSLTFTLSDSAKLQAQKQARQQAVEQAKQKAADLAAAADIKLGKLINVTESIPGQPQPFFARGDLALESSSDTTQLQPGSQEVTISVTLSYETL